MATNYLEQTVSGIQWRRYSSISVNNPYNDTSTVSVVANDVVSVPSATQPVTVGSHHFTANFDPAAVVKLRDPTTDALTGQVMTHATIYAILYSVCRQLDDNAAGVV